MISDVLFEARKDMEGYLKTSMYAKENWSPADYTLIESCLSVMKATQIMLDTPPSELIQDSE